MRNGKSVQADLQENIISPFSFLPVWKEPWMMMPCGSEGGARLPKFFAFFQIGLKDRHKSRDAVFEKVL